MGKSHRPDYGLLFFCWLTAVISIRIFCNLVLPLIISSLTWIVLAGIAALYIATSAACTPRGIAPNGFLATCR